MGKIAVAVSLLSSLVVSSAAVAGQPDTVPSAAAADAAAYEPKTEHDNTPWRFDMEQDGQRMTADQFDAWMKSKGVRVAKGAPTATPAAPDTAVAEDAPVTAAAEASAAAPEVQAGR